MRGKLPRNTIYAIASFLGDVFDVARVLLSLSGPGRRQVSEIERKTILEFLAALQTQRASPPLLTLTIDERKVVEEAVRSRRDSGGQLPFDRTLRRALGFVRKLARYGDARLRLTLITSSLCSRITPLELLPTFKALNANLVALSIIARDPLYANQHDFTLLRHASFGSISPKLFAWSDTSKWSPFSESSLHEWHDPHTWRVLPSFSRLESLSITGPSSVLWTTSLRDIAFPVLNELTLQTWSPMDLVPGECTRSDTNEKIQIFADFLANCPNLYDLRLVQPPDVWGPSMMQPMLRQVARSFTSRPLRVHLCACQISRLSFSAETSDCDSSSTRDSSELDARESALCALYDHIVSACDTIRRVEVCEPNSCCLFFPLDVLNVDVTEDFLIHRRSCTHNDNPPLPLPTKICYDNTLTDLCNAAFKHGQQNHSKF